MTNKDVVPKLFTVISVSLGALMFAIHVVIFNWSQFGFNVLLSMYVIIYSVVVVVIANNSKSCFNDSNYSVLIYYSLYTIFLQIALVIFTLIMWRKRRGIVY
jgi:hypothetical protein